eukprot:COSAG01_NODE_10796_length_2078_cov_1.301668_4_plen_48_part_00
MTSPGCEPPTAPQAAGSVEAYSAYSAPGVCGKAGCSPGQVEGMTMSM